MSLSYFHPNRAFVFQLHLLAPISPFAALSRTQLRAPSRETSLDSLSQRTRRSVRLPARQKRLPQRASLPFPCLLLLHPDSGGRAEVHERNCPPAPHFLLPAL